MDAAKMDENEWTYHGEGNKSLVVAHAQRCVVLRFLKFPPNRSKTSEEVFRHLQNIVDFSKNVMTEFFGENYVHYGEVVQLPLDFVKQLCLKIQAERPESRCDKDLDTLSGYAMCLPNLTRLHTSHFAEHRPILCVEIKPKCGFLPFSRHVAQEMKRRVCRYCMHQHLKVATGKWKQISRYCPLDLFSGNKQRMHFALKSLLQEAQNNLKIFKNGELIYGCRDQRDAAADWNELARHLKPFFYPSNGLVGGPHCTRAVIKELIHVITQTLLSPTDKGRPADGRGGPSAQARSCCEASPFGREPPRHGKSLAEGSGLPRGCLLYKTLQAQMLDLLDIEGLYPLYRRVERHLQEFPEQRWVRRPGRAPPRDPPSLLWPHEGAAAPAVAEPLWLILKAQLRREPGGCRGPEKLLRLDGRGWDRSPRVHPMQGMSRQEVITRRQRAERPPRRARDPRLGGEGGSF
ncbi:inositol-pentakisphosphate 2-kinase [Gracilinanus agilis]|uniref:inositol-pentakisphosphate 2-kinase n=1 Tax=Gracilinanus agilis TaxID=191870 RepID=UPI001CFE06E3|nr:inositol-pentakisphosphate 2-kinase [Gracilinanus agilis]